MVLMSKLTLSTGRLPQGPSGIWLLRPMLRWLAGDDLERGRPLCGRNASSPRRTQEQEARRWISDFDRKSPGREELRDPGS